MKKIVEVNKCPNCGGKLEKTGKYNILRCISCDSEFETEEEAPVAAEAPAESEEKKPAKKADGENPFTKTEWFDYRTEYKTLIKGHDSKEAVKTFVHCINDLGTSEDIIKFIKRELVEIPGICYKGKKEDKMNNFINKSIKGQVGADEKVLFYANSGIFSCGKKGFLVTDKKIIFCEKKPVVLEYSDLTKVAFDTNADYAFIRLNANYDTSFIVIDGGSHEPHGAFAALVCVLAFENEPDRDKIIICKYKDNMDDDE